MRIHDPRQIVERLKSKAVRLENGCLICHLKPGGQGYCQVGIDFDNVFVHRLVHYVAKGPIPKGYLVLHTCDNRRCMEPEHLWTGTHKDNSRDMAAKKRFANQWTEWKEPSNA